MWGTCKALLGNQNLMMLCAAYGIGGGMSSAWSSMQELDLQVLNITQMQAGWITFGGTICGNVGGLLVGHFIDRVRRSLQKPLIVGLTGLAALSALVYALLEDGVMPTSWTVGLPGFVSVFVVTTINAVAVSSSTPLFYELSIESAYPLSESTSIMAMTLVNNAGTLVLLLVPIASTNAFNFTFAAALTVLTLGLQLLYNQTDRRFAVDAKAVAKLGPAAGEGRLDDEGAESESFLGDGAASADGGRIQ
jgi:MFS family permease